MRRRRVHPALLLPLALCAGAALADGCSAAPPAPAQGSGGAGGDGPAGTGGHTTHTATTAVVTSSSGPGGGISIPDASNDVDEDVATNPCGSKCGPKELCDPDHIGFDDNCNGVVDEGCGCSAGDTHSCFKGDPSYHDVPGCFDGTMHCDEQGMWGPCTGGVHATAPDNCYVNDTKACHAIHAAPFADVNLHDGIGMFGCKGAPASQTWTVTCPAGVSPCPGVTGMNPADHFQPLQSGEYSVTYTATCPGQDGGMASCTYPLVVGAPGLRVELQWEHTVNDTGVDLDLHLHQPQSTQPWSIGIGFSPECTWSNCRFASFKPPTDPKSPKWFADPPAKPPVAVNWWLDPVPANNTCYSAPGGVGAQWKALGKGCHNPRLDLDATKCNAAVIDPNDPSFCFPENINVDYPPNGKWMRVGVHYYDNHGLGYDVHPTVKIFCDGALGAELGSGGYYTPTAPITFTPSDGGGLGPHRFWVVADVAFNNDKCGKHCTVKPVYSDAAAKTPFFTLDSAATTTFAPPYPPPP